MLPVYDQRANTSVHSGNLYTRMPEQGMSSVPVTMVTPTSENVIPMTPAGQVAGAVTGGVFPDNEWTQFERLPGERNSQDCASEDLVMDDHVLNCAAVSTPYDVTPWSADDKRDCDSRVKSNGDVNIGKGSGVNITMDALKKDAQLLIQIISQKTG